MLSEVSLDFSNSSIKTSSPKMSDISWFDDNNSKILSYIWFNIFLSSVFRVKSSNFLNSKDGFSIYTIYVSIYSSKAKVEIPKFTTFNLI